VTDLYVGGTFSHEFEPIGASVSAMERQRGHRFVWAWVVSAAVVVAGVLLIVFGLHGPRVGPSLPAPVGSVPAATSSISSGVKAGADAVFQTTSATPTAAFVSNVVTPASPAKSAGLRGNHATTTITRSAPVRLVIPSLGISVPVSQVGLNANGSVVSPTNYQVPGWYKDGYAPGQLGSAVILGHIDSSGVFSRIDDLKVGQQLQVTLADHTRLTFKVIGIRQYTNAGYPYKGVYGPEKYSALNLVSVGSVFTAPTGRSVSDIVVFTALVTS